MRVIVAVFVLAVAALGASASHPDAARACSGRQLDLRDALKMPHGAVYAGRITRADYAGVSWAEVTMDVEIVVRGPAMPELRRVEAGDICDGIIAGHWGYIVRGVRDPSVPGAGADDLFFRVSRYYGRNAVRAVGLPDTSIAPEAVGDVPAGVPWGWLAFSSAVGFAVAYGRLGVRTVRTAPFCPSRRASACGDRSEAGWSKVKERSGYVPEAWRFDRR